MAMHNARTSAERLSDAEPMPINFAFEIIDGELRTVSASDDEGRNYTVSIRLTDNVLTELCCCPGIDGTLRCLRVAQCSCSPI